MNCHGAQSKLNTISKVLCQMPNASCSHALEFSPAIILKNKPFRQKFQMLRSAKGKVAGASGNFRNLFTLGHKKHLHVRALLIKERDFSLARFPLAMAQRRPSAQRACCAVFVVGDASHCVVDGSRISKSVAANCHQLACMTKDPLQCEQRTR